MKNKQAILECGYNTQINVKIESDIYQAISSSFASPRHSGAVYSAAHGTSCVCVSFRRNGEDVFLYDVPLYAIELVDFENTVSYDQFIEDLNLGY